MTNALSEGIDWSSLMDRGENPFPDVPFADCSLHIDITKINELVRILITNAVLEHPYFRSIRLHALTFSGRVYAHQWIRFS